MKSNPNGNTDVPSIEPKITNKQDPMLAPKIAPLCEERFLLSKPTEGIWEPIAEVMLSVPILERVSSFKNTLINTNVNPIKKNVNAREGHVSLLDSDEFSLMPPIMSAIIVVDANKINSSALSLGGNVEIESENNTIPEIMSQRTNGIRVSKNISLESEKNGVVRYTASPNKIPTANVANNG